MVVGQNKLTTAIHNKLTKGDYYGNKPSLRLVRAISNTIRNRRKRWMAGVMKYF